MSGEMILSESIINKIVLTGDISSLNEQQKREYMIYRCSKVGIDPAGMPFTIIPQKQKDGTVKEMLYANKECTAQLSSNRRLSAVCISEGEVLGGVYKVVYRVKEGERETEDCGTVSLMWFDKDSKGFKKLEGEGLSNAIMKAHTKAKRRAILTHCGLGMNDETEVLVVPDQKEEVKPTDFTVSATTPVTVAPNGSSQNAGNPAEVILSVQAAASHVEPMRVTNGNAWKVTLGSIDYLTKDAFLAEQARIFADRCSMVKASYKAIEGGRLKLLSLEEVKSNGK